MGRGESSLFRLYWVQSVLVDEAVWLFVLDLLLQQPFFDERRALGI